MFVGTLWKKLMAISYCSNLKASDKNTNRAQVRHCYNRPLDVRKELEMFLCCSCSEHNSHNVSLNEIHIKPVFLTAVNLQQSITTIESGGVN